MKSLTTILLVILTQIITYSQEFAPIGAKWHVQVAEPFAPEWSGTLTNESIRDTMLKGLSCKIIFKSQPTIFNEIYGEYVLCQNGDSIFHYIQSLDSLNLVMDFGATPGEFWESFDQANNYESFGFERNYKYQVDSIGTILSSNNVPLNIQYITQFSKLWTEPDSLYRFPRQRMLINQIGFKSALLPTNGGDGFTDDQLETDIRCYQDNEIGIIMLTDDNNCVTTSTHKMRYVNFEVSPNPTNGIIQLNGIESADKISLIITDLSGQNLGMYENQNRINIGHLNNGIYLLNLIGKESIYTRKIVLLK